VQRRDILHSNAGKECYQNYSGPKLAHSRVKFCGKQQTSSSILLETQSKRAEVINGSSFLTCCKSDK